MYVIPFVKAACLVLYALLSVMQYKNLTSAELLALPQGRIIAAALPAG